MFLSECFGLSLLLSSVALSLAFLYAFYGGVTCVLGYIKKNKVQALLLTGTTDPHKGDAQGLDTGMWEYIERQNFL